MNYPEPVVRIKVGYVFINEDVTRDTQGTFHVLVKEEYLTSW